MKGILADVNIQGYVDFLIQLMRAEPWTLFWDHLHLDYLHFTDVGLAENSPDSLVWQTCQERALLLITDNRNCDDAHSLQATIESRNEPTSLPVVTIGNIPSLRRSGDYAFRVIESLFDALLRMDELRGTGRLFVP